MSQIVRGDLSPSMRGGSFFSFQCQEVSVCIEQLQCQEVSVSVVNIFSVRFLRL